MENKIYLKDVAGYETVKKEAKKIIEVLGNYKKYKELGVCIPKGLILSGEPGVGKTMLAKAIANESGVAFFEFESDEAETDRKTIKAIKELFQKAKESSPSIIFIDELDELVITYDFITDNSRKITKILLTEIDGILSSDGVMVISTTNHKSKLPEPLLRSGRMDKKITLEMPTLKDREAIFKLYLSKNDKLASLDAKELASKTTGFSGSDIKTLINETLIECCSNNKEVVCIEDFEKMIPVVLFKDIKKDEETPCKEMTCYHEVGHFIAEYVQTGIIGAISIERYGNVQGHIMFDTEYYDLATITKKSVKRLVTTALAGMAAEEIMCDDISCGATDDVSKAKIYISLIFGVGAYGFDKIPSSVNNSPRGMASFKNEENPSYKEMEVRMLTEAYDDAKKIIESNKSVVEALVKELKKSGRISKNELKDLMELHKVINPLINTSK